MRGMLWYSAAVIVGYIALFAYCWNKDYAVSEDRNGVIELLALVAIPVILGLIVGGKSAAVLWQKFVVKDPSVSQTAWVLAVAFFAMIIFGALQTAIGALTNTPIKIPPAMNETLPEKGE